MSVFNIMSRICLVLIEIYVVCAPRTCRCSARTHHCSIPILCHFHLMSGRCRKKTTDEPAKCFAFFHVCHAFRRIESPPCDLNHLHTLGWRPRIEFAVKRRRVCKERRREHAGHFNILASGLRPASSAREKARKFGGTINDGFDKACAPAG